MVIVKYSGLAVRNCSQ